MSSSQMSTSFQSSSSNDDSENRQAGEIGNLSAEYVFSWRWLLGGIIAVTVVSAGVVALYFYQTRQMPNYILATADKLEKDGKLVEAVDLLDSYRASHPENTRIWQRLTELFNRVIASEGVGFDRYQKAIDVNRQMKGRLEGKDVLEISNRIMKWEWDRGRTADALKEARELLNRCQQMRIPLDTYPLAWQVYTKAKFSQMLLNQPYRPSDLQDINVPSTMDQLLEKVYNMDRSDIEIAEMYAEFTRNYDNEIFRQNSSDIFLQIPNEQRVRSANEIINNIVRDNPDNPMAYISRYLFRARYNMAELDRFKPGLNADIAKAIELDPGNIRARIQAGTYTGMQAEHARRSGDAEAYERLRQETIAHFDAIAKYHPRNTTGYRFLGDLYYRQRELEKAVEVWLDGADKIKPFVDIQLHGRLIFTLVDLEQFDKAQQELNRLNAFLHNFKVGDATNLEAEKQTNDIRSLLQARIFASEGAQLRRQAEQARLAGDNEKSARLYKLADNRVKDAVILYEKQLDPFGHFMSEYAIERDNVFYQILGSAFFTFAQILSSQEKWSQADVMYEKAANLPTLYDLAMIGRVTALQQLNRNDDAMTVLSEAIERSPNNEAIRLLYTQALFRNEMMQSSLSRDFSAIEAQMKRLEDNKAILPRPWAVDIMKIQMQYVRDSASDNPDRAIAAQQVALEQYRRLEKTSSPQAPGKPSGEEAGTYDQHPDFLATLAGIYSSLGSVYDFERVTELLRETPGGLATYYSERINDAIRRNDKQSVDAILAEAIGSDLPEGEKQQFMTMQRRMQSMGDIQNSEQFYKQLEKEFERNPDALKPQTVFTLANMAIDREDWKAAQVYEDRLKAIESEEKGTYWRFVQARRILNQDTQTPDFARAKELQKEIVSNDSRWDMAYVLGAFIEERAPLADGDSEEARRSREIELYKQAIRFGNTDPQVWDTLLSLLVNADRFDEEKSYREQAVLRRIPIQSNQGRFPQPYDRYYQEVFQALSRSDYEEADRQARACVIIAQRKKEPVELIFDLNMTFGKMLMDEGYTDLAEKFLRALYVRGGIYVYPLAVCLAKAGRVDEAFALILDEIDKTPTAAAALVPSILVLLGQVQPSEQILERVDQLMLAIENGYRDVLEGTLDKSDSERTIDLPGEKRIRSVIIRFPGQSEIPDPSTIRPIISTSDEVILPTFDAAGLGTAPVQETAPPPAVVPESAPTP